MSDRRTSDAAAAVRAAAVPLGGSRSRNALREAVGDARLVLLGEASHGTHEFYRERAAITRWLIEHAGFDGVAAEADWPDAYRVNCFVRGTGEDRDADEALSDFARFPSWMWRNLVVRDFVSWLCTRNALQEPARRVGFYGLDLYSLHASAAAVVRYLERVDPEAARRARARYGCFDRSGRDAQRYGYAASLGGAESCEDDVVEQLVELRANAAEYATRDGRLPDDAYFYAEQNARVAAGAERYYREMYRGEVSSWNVRDEHMADMLDALDAHLSRDGRRAKIVVWAHNSHIGDARATGMAGDGELNLGQLARERHGDDVRLVGFTTHDGSVTAAHEWGMPPARMRVRPALPQSHEAVMHQTGLGRFLVRTREESDARPALLAERLTRAIGVVYRPRTERASHYFPSRMADQFDVVLHLDRTSAVVPLEAWAGDEVEELPATYPTAV